MLNPLIFRAYDIRGIADQDLQPDCAKLIGQASGIYLIKNFGNKIVIGRDCRISSPEIQKAFIEGLLEVGCDVTDIGLVTSPMVYFAVCEYGFDGGVAITASHNPKEYNGIKLVGKNAHSICGDDLQEILQIAIRRDEAMPRLPSLLDHSSMPRLPSLFDHSSMPHLPSIQKQEALTQKNIFDDYSRKITKVIKPKRSLKVGIDAGNGTAGIFAVPILKKLGFEIHEIYCEPDGNFPNHEANPEYAENLKDLAKMVKEKNLDLAVGFDGDGDRIGIIDKNGKHLSADYLIILLATDLLKRHKESKIVFDSKCSIVLQNEIERLGGKGIMAKTGHSFIESKMHEIGALLGGECSGHLFFGENYYGFDDAIFAAAKILEILSQDEKTLEDHFSHLPKTFMTPEIKAACPDEIKSQLVEKIKDYFVKKYDCITIDGVRINFDKFSWGAIRCSNTTPCLTMRFESNTENKLHEIEKIVYDHLKEYPEIDNSWFENLKFKI